MSTELRGGRRSWLVGILMAAVGFLGCRTPTAARLEAVCDGVPVVQRITLSVDSVRSTGAVELEQLRGERYDLVLTLLPGQPAGSCTDRSGAATWQGFLPEALARATAGPQTATWHLSGPAVQVRLNPQVADNNVSITLPLSAKEGSWDLSTFVGTVARGRVTLETPR